MNMYQKIKNKIRVWAVSWIFKIYFRTFMYPFEKADITYLKMNDYEKANYLREVHGWVNSSAYKIESQEIIRQIYEDLATKPYDELMVNAYRLALLVEQDKQKRLVKKAQNFNQMESIQ